MLKPIHRLLLIALAALTWSACEQVIEIDLPEHVPQLVVNCTFSPDSVLRADISISKHLQDTASLKFPQDVLAVVFEDGNAWDTLHYAMGPQGASYRGSRLPTAGRHYFLRASKAGMPNAEGENTIPQPIDIQTISFRDSIPDFGDGTAYDEITFSFNDPQGSSDFYVVAVQLRDSFEVSPGVYEHFNFSIFSSSDDPTVEADFLTNQLSFTDNTFDGQTRSLRVRVNHEDMQYGTPYLVLGKVSEDYLRYLRTMSAYSETQFSPFAEPVIIHSNMSPDMGIFAAYSERAVLIVR